MIYQQKMMLLYQSFVMIVSVLFILVLYPTTYGIMYEPHRLQQYNNRNYTWPIVIDDYIPNTIAWKTLFESRFQQISRMVNRQHRYDFYKYSINSAKLVPNYTEFGVGLSRCSDELLHSLQQIVHDGLSTAREEQYTYEIEAPQVPLFIERWDIMSQIVRELHPYAEAWSNISLQSFGAYGFRLYRNDSRLNMHYDIMQTHIISMILHVGSSDDSKPWPIFIEDLNGNTLEVILHPGDILFYESAKCLHGRPKRFDGSWYTSVFIHYYPTNWKDIKHDEEADYAIPPIWDDDPPSNNDYDNTIPVLEAAGASWKEPDCPNAWCRSLHSKKWNGPGQEGYWIAPTLERFSLDVNNAVPIDTSAAAAAAVTTTNSNIPGDEL